MKKKYLLFLIPFIIFACNKRQQNTLNQTLNPANVSEQVFVINTSMDTALITKAGIRILIAANSIKSASPQVSLQVKEALGIQQILLAGLTTNSRSGALRSGGMICVNTKEESTILKPIKISIPSISADSKMELYKGEVLPDSSINWKDSTPLASVDTLFSQTGQAIFLTNCASCHGILKDVTGPALKGITKRASKEWIHSFVRNNQAVIASGDKYANNLYLKYTKTQMNLFPNLTNKEIDAVVAYVESNTTLDQPTKYDNAISDK